MAENTADKEALKATKEAEKAAKKAKQDRIKQSKPKKEGSVLSRAGKTVKKFWKDFIGTVKKIVWPTGTQVIKNSLVVLVTILVIGLVVFGIDQGLTFVIGQASKLAVNAGEQVFVDEETSAEEADVTADATEAEKETEAEEKTEEETSEEETSAEAEEETTAEN